MNTITTATLREVLGDLPYLVAVADNGGVTAAADELGVPQPSVSRGIARLADRLGMPILRRNGRGVELSAEAEELLPHARRALAAVNLGVDLARNHALESANTVSIAFQHTLGRVVVPALLRATLEQRPETRFELRQGSREFCVDALESGEVDAVLLSPPLGKTDNTATVRLYAEPLVLTVAPQHRLAKRSSVRIDELAGEPMLHMRVEFGLRGQVDRLFAAAGVEPGRVFEGEDIHTLRGLVAVGLGSAILPPAVPAASDVVEVAIAGGGATREVGISWRRDGEAAPAAEALSSVARHFADWLPGH